MNTGSRRFVILLSALVFVGGVIGFQLLSRQKTAPPRKPPGDTGLPTLVAAPADPRTVPVPIPFQGRTTALEKVDLFAEVNGLFLESTRPFKEGMAFRKGEVLARLDDREAALALHGQRASFLTSLAQMMPDLRIEFPDRSDTWEQYIRSVHPEKTLNPLPQAASDREKYFLAARNIPAQYYAIRSAEERLTKYRILAPYDGALTQVDVQTGTLIRPGQRLGTFLRTGQFEVRSTISLRDMPFVRPGSEASLESEDTGEAFQGRVIRIGDILDPSTQMVPVFLSLQGASLREGMYVRGRIYGRPDSGIVILPKDLLIQGEKVWTIRDSSLVFHPVTLVRSTRTDVLLKDLPEGTLVVRKVIPGLYEGMKVSWIQP